MQILTVVFMYAIWTAIFPLCKIALAVSPPLFLTAVRMLLASTLLLGYLAFFNRNALKITPKQLLAISVLGVFQIYLNNALEAWSLQFLTATKTCFIYSLSPFLTVFFSYLYFGEKMNGRKWLGLLIGFVGLLPVLCTQKGVGSSTNFFSLSWAELGMVSASICTVYGWILLRKIVKDETPMSPLFANGASMGIGGLLALAHSLLVESWDPIPVSNTNFGVFIQGVVIMTFISNILCYNLYGLSLKRFTATFLSFLGLLSPIFASFSSWILLGEQPSPIIFGSTMIISFGAWLIYGAELKQGYIQKDKALLDVSSL